MPHLSLDIFVVSDTLRGFIDEFFRVKPSKSFRELISYKDFGGILYFHCCLLFIITFNVKYKNKRMNIDFSWLIVCEILYKLYTSLLCYQHQMGAVILNISHLHFALEAFSVH